MHKNFKDQYGPWALVLGSVEGMGACYAERFAAAGLHLLLVDHQAEALQEQARELQGRHGTQTQALVCDLRDAEQFHSTLEEAAGKEVGLLACNAAFAIPGRWENTSAEEKQAMNRVNCEVPMLAIDRLCRPMMDRGQGGVILMSSFAALQGAYGQSVYAAGKAYIRILGETLWAEFREFGVDVLTVITPMVRTPHFEREAKGVRSRGLMKILEPQEVVDAALAALGRAPTVIPERNWRIMYFLTQRIMRRRRLIETTAQRMSRHFPGRRGGGSATKP